MSPAVLFGGRAQNREKWHRPLLQAFESEGLQARLAMSPADMAPEDVEYLLLEGDGEVRDVSGSPRLKAVFSLWAGVDWLDLPSLPAEVPVLRMVDEGMTQGMTDYVAGHVLRYHLDLDEVLSGRPGRQWDMAPASLSHQRGVGMMGLGVLGGASARVLRDIGFTVTGWSRTPKRIEGVTTFAGRRELPQFLAGVEILVLLLPLTPDTEELIDAEILDLLPVGARLINAARGGLINDAALLSALDSGRLAHATLDAFREEPLPPEHAFLQHPHILITPHIASVTRPETASHVVARQIIQCESGRVPENSVDRTMGY